MTFDDALPLVEDGKAMFSESLGVTMFRKCDEDRITYVSRQQNWAGIPFPREMTAINAALATDWVLSGVELRSEAV